MEPTDSIVWCPVSRGKPKSPAGRWAGLVLPAYAGMIPQIIRVTCPRRCAPRVCGDDPKAGILSTQSLQVLPAYAGMIPTTTVWVATPSGAPRVCGDDPTMPSVVAEPV